MKKALEITLCLAAMSFSLPLCAQSWEEVRADGASYIWGEGWGKSVEEADKEALTALSGKISLTIVSEFKSVEGQVSTGRETTRYSSVDHKLVSFSNASLCDTGFEILSSGRRSHVVRWVSRRELERMKRQRTCHLLEYVISAQRCEAANRFSDALRQYYWAYAMIMAYPELSSVSFDTSPGDSHSLLIWLPQKINSLLTGITVSIYSITDKTATLSFLYNGKPTHGVEFSFFDGCQWSENITVKDGKKSLNLSYNTRPEYIHIRLEHLFLNYVKADRELQYALESIKNEPVRKAYIACR